MKTRLMFVAALAVAIGTIGISSAAADTQGPINFETYTLGAINGQQSWSDTGGYDANVANVASYPFAAAYGFGTKALQISDAVTSGSFGDQTFSPGLVNPAGESGLSHFDASFSIGSATGSAQLGQHVSVSPDDGNGARMSYLRFEDQTGGIDVYFDDVTTGGSLGSSANFTDTKIATLPYTSAHTVSFAIDFKPGAGNDVVVIKIDGTVKATGTTWEDYYRYDPEQTGSGNTVPPTSKLLFREGGSANLLDAGKGYLIDGVSLDSLTPPPPCTPTGFYKDGINLTASQIGGSALGVDLNATGCNIGVYYGPGTTGIVRSSNVHGSNYYGVLVNGGSSVTVDGSTIHDIGETPLNGTQHGNAIVYTNGSTGTVRANRVYRYQKNGITVKGGDTPTGSVSGTGNVSVTNNTVTGEGHISYIAQNGIQISYGASATVTGNTVSGNWYTPATVTACGLLFYQAGGVKQNGNNLFDNQKNLCNFGRGGGGVTP